MTDEDIEDLLGGRCAKHGIRRERREGVYKEEYVCPQCQTEQNADKRKLLDALMRGSWA